MLIDYTIREEDRPEIIHTLILELIRIKGNHMTSKPERVMHNLISSLLYRKIQFGYYSTLQLYEILFRLHQRGLKGLYELEVAELREMDGFVTLQFWEPSEEQRAKTFFDEVWSSPIIRDMFGLHLDNTVDHYRKIGYIGYYTPPAFIEVPEPPKKSHLTTVKNFLATCIGLSRQPEIFETRQP